MFSFWSSQEWGQTSFHRVDHVGVEHGNVSVQAEDYGQDYLGGLENVLSGVDKKWIENKIEVHQIPTWVVTVEYHDEYFNKAKR